MREALEDVDSVYYLIHSLSVGPGFRELDIQAARNFGQAAKQAGIRHIVYLGALGDPDAGLSAHLRSRQECGAALRESGVPVTELRAGVIIGSGSLSFEMIRHLVERLPVMVCPRWIYSRIQPIAIDDLLDYLAAALNVPECRGLTIEVGGKDATTYRGLMLGYAKARGLRRILIPVPVLTPRLSSYWVHWMTPIPAPISAALIEGLRNDVVVAKHQVRNLFLDVIPRDCFTSISNALEDLSGGMIDTSWSDAAWAFNNTGGTGEPGVPRGPDHPSAAGAVLPPRPRKAYQVCAKVGAGNGWYFANWAWRLWGMLDRTLGGAGLRRGRRHPDHLRVGDSVDFWRVEELDPGRLIRFRSEMKLHGNAWLQFEVRSDKDGTTQLELTAVFGPRGLSGLLYWYLLYPFHAWIFRGMIREIARRAERQ